VDAFYSYFALLDEFLQQVPPRSQPDNPASNWKASVDNTGKFSAALSRFAMVIFSLLDQEWSGHPRNRSRQSWNPTVGFALRLLSRSYSGSLRQRENLTKNLAACHKPLMHLFKGALDVDLEEIGLLHDHGLVDVVLGHGDLFASDQEPHIGVH
jgi:hypothetical protein